MIQVEIISPQKKIFEGTVTGVQLPGIDGSFEIFQSHAPLVSALKKGQLVVIQDATVEGRMAIDIEGGFAEVANNKLSILLA